MNIIIKVYHEVRLAMLVAVGYLMYLTTDLVSWYKTLEDPTNGQSGVISSIAVVTVGAIASFAATKGANKDDK